MYKLLPLREHISVSQIESYKNCSSSFANSSFLEESVNDLVLRNNKNVGAEFGSMIHSVIDKVSKLAVEQYEGYCYNIPFEIILDFLNKEIILYPSLIEVNFFQRANVQLEYWYNFEKERAAKIIDITDSNAHGTYRLLGVEFPFEVYTSSGQYFKGFIDRIETNNLCSPGQYCIIDFKTGFLSSNYLNQFVIYTLALQKFIDQKITTLGMMIQLEHEHYRPYHVTPEVIEEKLNIFALTKESIDFLYSEVESIFNKNLEDGAVDDFLNKKAVPGNHCFHCSRRVKCSTYLSFILQMGMPCVANETRQTPEVVYSYSEYLKQIERSIKKEISKTEDDLLQVLYKQALEFKEEHPDKSFALIVDSLSGKKIELTIGSTSKRVLNVQEVVKILLEEHCHESLSTTLKYIDDLLKNRPDLESKLKPYMLDTPSSKIEVIETEIKPPKKNKK